MIWFKDKIMCEGGASINSSTGLYVSHNISANNARATGATRISNLNARQPAGWYSWSSGTNGAPTTYGVVLYVHWGTDSDFAQIAIGTNNALYTRYYVNGAFTSWSTK